MKPLILLVDDEPNILRLLEYNLQDKFELILKSDGLEAMEWLQEGNIPHLIVTDIMMPNIDGIELVRNIRNNETFNQIPIILLSAKSQSEDRIRGLSQRLDDYLIKPFDPDELISRIDNLL